MHTPTIVDVLLAQRQIRPYLPPTPLHSYSAMTNLLGTDTFINGYA